MENVVKILGEANALLNQAEAKLKLVDDTDNIELEKLNKLLERTREIDKRINERMSKLVQLCVDMAYLFGGNTFTARRTYWVRKSQLHPHATREEPIVYTLLQGGHTFNISVARFVSDCRFGGSKGEKPSLTEFCTAVVEAACDHLRAFPAKLSHESVEIEALLSELYRLSKSVARP